MRSRLPSLVLTMLDHMFAGYLHSFPCKFRSQGNDPDYLHDNTKLCNTRPAVCKNIVQITLEPPLPQYIFFNTGKTGGVETDHAGVWVKSLKLSKRIESVSGGKYRDTLGILPTYESQYCKKKLSFGKFQKRSLKIWSIARMRG